MFSLVYWMTFLGGFLQTYVFVICYNYTLENKKILITKDWIIMTVATLMVACNNLYNKIGLIMPLSLIIITIMFYLIFKEKGIKLFYKVFLICIISIIADLSLSLVLSFIVADVSILNASPILKLAYNIINSYFFFFLFKFTFILWLVKKIEEILYKYKQLFLIGSLTLMVIISISIIYNQDYHDFLFYMLSLTLILLLIILISFYFKQIYDNKLLEFRSVYLEDNLEILKNTFNENRTLKHNIINDFLFVKTLCDEKAQKLIDRKMKKYYKDYEAIDSLKNIPPGFQGLLYAKLRNARKFGINISVNLNESIDYTDISYKKYIDLCDMLSVLLDNAIEAAKNVKNKVIYIKTYQEKEDTIIEIINTFDNEIDLNRIGDHNYSTKNRGSGIGLDYIKKLNKHLRIEKEIIQNLFKITITIIK